MEPWKFLRSLVHGSWTRRREAEELRRLRRQNVRLTAVVEQASQALSAAPLWHSQHRMAMDTLSEAMDRMRGACDKLR